jgi:two-component system response regulator HydG
MRARDLDLRELLDFEPKGGILRFASDRAVLLNTVALGVLRQELIETVGSVTARGILTRFGYAHGWRTAETLKTTFNWETPHEWRLAGGRLHQLQGFLVYEPVPRAPGESPRRFAESIWRDSYEAQEHLLHIGQSSEPVCWTLCGFASGYLSCCAGRPIYCVEERCRAKGDAFCFMVGDTEEAWGDTIKDQIAFYSRESLDNSLRHVTNLLKLTERQLAARRRELARVDVQEPRTGIVAHSEKMQAVLDQVHRVAQVDSTVMLTGESGVGKEVLARLIHDESARAALSFLAVNCAAVPEALIESELFGHLRGAFTGATQDRVGLFEAANRDAAARRGGRSASRDAGQTPACTAGA